MEEREALRAWRLAELKKAIQEGLDSGEPERWDRADAIKAEGRRILHAARDIGPDLLAE